MHHDLHPRLSRVIHWAKRRTRRGSDDRGSVMILAIVYVVVGGMIVGALLAYSAAVIRVRPPFEKITNARIAATSATSMAITMQRDVGPRTCFTTGTATWTVSGQPVQTTCTTVGTPFVTGGGRYGIVTTSNRNDVTAVSGSSGTPPLTPIDGPMFVNSGRVTGQVGQYLVKDADITYSSYTSARQPVNRYRNPLTDAVVGCTDPALSTDDSFATGTSPVNGTSYTHTHSCVNAPWWTRVGDNPPDDAPDVGWMYPRLPQIPTYERPGSQASVGTCTVFYPGRYVSGGTLTLTAGNNYYFASGVYFFTRPIVINSGARVVFGEGRYTGCVNDADAAFAATAPRNHEITGKGATLLLGGGATLTIDDASVRFNRRVSTSANRGSEGISIRTVSFGVDTNDVEVPKDIVQLPNGSTVNANVHFVKPSTLSPNVTYTASTLGPSNYAVDVSLDGSSAASNRFVADGYVFTPNTRVRIASSGTAYQLRLTGGLVAYTVQITLPQLPPNVSATATPNYQVGVVTEFIQRWVRLTSTTSVNGQIIRSVAELEVHVDKSYAIVLWVVDS